MEKKLIQERVEHAVKLESMKRKQAQRETNEVDGQLEAAQNKFIELQKENIAMTETLADLKRQELELLREVAETIAGPTQKELVQGILDDARIVNMQLENMKQVKLISEPNQVQSFLDQLQSLLNQLKSSIICRRCRVQRCLEQVSQRRLSLKSRASSTT